MEDTTSPPESSISISEGTVPQLAFIRTNSMPSSESENTTQLPAETIPTKLNFLLTQSLDITAPVTTMTREPNPQFSSDVSVSSTAVGSAPASPSTLQKLKEEHDDRTKDQFKHKAELTRAKANLDDLQERVSDLEFEIEDLKRNCEENFSNIDKNLKAANILNADRQQELLNIRKQLDAANGLAADRQQKFSKARALQTETLWGWNTDKIRSTELEKLLFEATELNDKHEKEKAEMGEKTTRLTKQLLEAAALVREYQKQSQEPQEQQDSRSELAIKVAKIEVQLLESKASNSKLKKQLVEFKTRNVGLEAAAKLYGEEIEKKDKELASMTELAQTFSQSGDTTAEDFKRVQADYQRERKWRESAEKKEVRLEKSLKETMELLKASKNKLATQEKKQEKARKDFENNLAKLQCQINEPNVDIELRGLGLKIGKKGKWILCCLVILVIAIMFGMLSNTWQKI